jgi:hypothetical protein
LRKLITVILSKIIHEGNWSMVCQNTQFWGPLLSLLPINYLIENVQEAKLVLFTDDTTMTTTGKDEFDLQHKMFPFSFSFSLIP